jgi:hypothetical protein
MQRCQRLHWQELRVTAISQTGGDASKTLAGYLALFPPIGSLLNLLPVTSPSPTGRRPFVWDQLDWRWCAALPLHHTEDVDVRLAREEELEKAQALILTSDGETQ